MRRLREIQPLVEYQLTNNKATRADDSLLYSKVCEMIDSDISLMPFATVLENRAHFGIPGFETVRRARQKLQAERVNLRPPKAVEAMRAEAEKEFFEYALE